MRTDSSLDTNQPIYITEQCREELFNEIHRMELQDLQSDFDGNIKRFYKSIFTAEILETYCLGKTGRSDYAYAHIANLSFSVKEDLLLQLQDEFYSNNIN